jgi:hypothetical protein
MPQLSKGGKFVYGKSLIREGLLIQLPPQAIREYDITIEGKVYLFTGSKSTGGFCVTRKGLLLPSNIGNILKDTPLLLNHELPEGKFVPYKGRHYCWLGISPEGRIVLPKQSSVFLYLEEGMELLSIRSSNIAFTMGAKGPLLEMAANYQGHIEVF